MSTAAASPLELLRRDLLALEPYRHASWGDSGERLNANESPWRPAGDTTNAGLNRDPEPYPRALEARLARLYGVPAERVLAARGSDEGIDLITRAALVAGRDAILCCPPTFAMYAVCARIQGAAVVEVPLTGPGYDLDVAGIDQAMSDAVRVVFLCSPNNPTGGAVPLGTIDSLAAQLAGRALLVVDEAYGEFSRVPSATALLDAHPHLVVLRTLSKAYALAGARVGAVLAHPELIDLLRRIVPPYALATSSIEAVQAALAPAALAVARERIELLCSERDRVTARLGAMPGVIEVTPSDANFILVRAADPGQLLAHAREAGFVLRDFSSGVATAGCLRISIGTPEQNDRLVAAIGRLCE